MSKILEQKIDIASKLAKDRIKREQYLSTLGASDLLEFNNTAATIEAPYPGKPVGSAAKKKEGDRPSDMMTSSLYVGAKLDPQSTSKGKLNELEEMNVVGVIQKLKKAVPISRFLMEVLRFSTTEKMEVETPKFKKYLEENYGKVLNEKEQHILSRAIDKDYNSKISVYELRDFFKTYSHDEQASLEFSLRVLAREIDLKEISTSAWLAEQRIDTEAKYSVEQFTKEIGQGILKSSLRESANLFNQLDKGHNSEISLRPFIEAVNEFRTQKHTESFSISKRIEDASKPTSKPTSKPATNLEEILLKLNSSKAASLHKLFQLLIEGTDDPEKGIPIYVVNESISSLYGDILSEAEIKLFQDNLDVDQDDALQLEEMLAMMSESLESPAKKAQLNFIICASLLDKANISTADYFYNQQIFSVNDYLKNNFIEKIKAADYLYSYDFEEIIFEFLAAGSDHVRGSDLYEAVDCYRRTKPKDKIKQEKREMTNTDVARNMQKIRRETLLKKVNQAITAKGYTPLGVYNMIDEQKDGNLSVEQLRRGFQKLLPKLTAEDITELSQILDCNKNGFIDRKEYAVIMMDQIDDGAAENPKNASQSAEKSKTDL